MELVLSGLQWKTLLIYLDDIILFSSNFSQHLERLDFVLKRLQAAGLKLKPEKCNIFQTEVTFLGHVVSEQGIQPNPDNITKILECPVPKTVKGVRHILGLGSYYRRFIRNFSDLVKPLTELTKKSSKFVWFGQLAFEHLKQQFASPGILAYPRDEGEYILDTDASDDAIGAMAYQLKCKWGLAYKCMHCIYPESLLAEKNRVEVHILKRHLALDKARYYCTLCMFRCNDRKNLDRHLVSFVPHLRQREVQIAGNKYLGDLAYLKESPAITASIQQ
ncbi:Retrovirus-related Pol polyprotein from transposon 297,Retrovirus-related Pol polyprotein from transposon 17.6 [Mytilus coruscus]|uniref:Retrovirus-related Pol polyprotein from transposon 297,Retrovirus-related Pol polyprotein from transposon 17.6 n=1 Tax=Mytilus coruscus TaxID=42192 RepID=A0A6J8C1X0_MYTCO|nr:Retrovirus-related Pol polyprotein from transposon 297,Retrovirus-related Pol polyprotein from transposon 17.6 [Mytilus coruscus]